MSKALYIAGWMLLAGPLLAQVQKVPNPLASAGGAVVVDQVIAVVNGDLVLESDVDEERRFQAFAPYGDLGEKFSRETAIQRLIDRELVLQQAKLQPDDEVTTAQAAEELQTVRKEIPACKQNHCENDASWVKFIHDQGFTPEELTERWRQRMQLLKFIEVRFRMGVQITPEQIKEYYDKTMLPEYARRNVAAPKLEVVSDRIQEVLMQKQVSSLLDDWLKSLKAQGTVRMMKPGEVTP